MRAVLVLLACLVAASAAVAGVTRDTLWVVTRTCVAAQSTIRKPFPCLRVDFGDKGTPGFAVLKAPLLKTEVVVMPIARVAGLEDVSLRNAAGAAYWRAAMASRHYVTDALGGRLDLPDVAMAVNSRGGRSQDQLHIHLDCVKPSVRAVLQAHATVFNATWKRLPFRLEDERYYGKLIPDAALEGVNPFAHLAHLPGPQDLKATSFAMVSTAPDDPVKGAYLLAYRSDASHAEWLLDHDCASAGRPSQ